MAKTVDIIFGGNAGSEGKGKFAGYLALVNNYDHAISNFFPNAGHTWVSNSGEKVITRYLPSSLCNRNTKLYLGPGSAIDVRVLDDEINTYDQQYNISERLKVHPRASIVDDSHIFLEKVVGLQRIGSTLKGGSAALALKAMRVGAQKLAQDEEQLQRFDKYSVHELLNSVEEGESVLIEGAQGYELDINYGHQYPYTTSRQTTPAQLLADAGLPISSVRDVYCVIRAYPIRVGGPSGPLGGDEIDWRVLEDRCGAPEGTLAEYTTVTKQERRVFETDINALSRLAKQTKPTKICLNFIQHINYDDLYKTQYDDLSNQSKQFIENVEAAMNTPVMYIGTGPYDAHIIVKR